MRLRNAWKIAGPIYPGTEIDLGGLASAPQMRVESDGPTIGDPTALFVAVRAVVGARAFVTSTLSLSGVSRPMRHAHVPLGSFLEPCREASV